MGNKSLWLIAAITFTLDLALKYFIPEASATLIPGVLALNTTKNTGFALGLLPGGAWIALVFSALIVAGILFLLARVRVRGLAGVALGLLIGGALGNLYDRLFLGYVRDMFELLFMNFYIFNIADVGVTVGALLAAVSLLFFGKEWQKK